MPVFNGEEFLEKKFDSILNQTFQDFEIIISDNKSLDSTSQICKKYMAKNQNISYYLQKEHVPYNKNWIFVLEQARSEYFVWTSVDDLWTNDFLEKNIKFLESNAKFVGSVGLVKRYGPPVKEYLDLNEDSIITRLYKKFRRQFRPFGTYPMIGTTEYKIRLFFKKFSSYPIYGVFRTEKLKQSIIQNLIPGWDCAMLLNIITHGDIHVINEIMIYYHSGGMSSKSSLINYRFAGYSLLHVTFPATSLIIWCGKRFGKKLFLKNFDQFLWMLIMDISSLMIEPIRIIRNMRLRNIKFL